MEYTVYDIAGIYIGGHPGEYAPVMIGSIFYSGDPCIIDSLRGKFNRDMALRGIDLDRKMAQKYGLGRIIDLIGDTEEAICRYIDFIAKEDDAPFLIDSIRPEVRLAGALYAMSHGLVERAIYNSLDVHWTEGEIKGIRATGINMGVILAFDAKRIKPESCMDILQESNGNPGLLELAKNAGFEKILIDPGVLDLVSMGWKSKSIEIIKEATGLPCGCAPSNALYSWKRKVKLESPVFEAAGAAILSRSIYSGADFVFYGPLSNATWAYPAVGVAAALVAYDARLEKKRPKDKGHPLYRLFN